MSRVLVTGGGGFIGSHIVRGLLARGDEVRVIDTFATGRRENLADIQSDIDLREVDIRDAPALLEASEDIDVIIHQAALPSVPRSVQEPELTYEVNVTGTHNVLLAARERGVRSVVMASSSSVYGDLAELPKHEDMLPSPLSPYAGHKLANEILGLVFARCYNIRVTCLRYFNVFGPRQNPKSQYAAVIPNFMTRLLSGSAPVIYGDGEQTRDFTHVDNVVAANLAAADRQDEGPLVVNIANGLRTSVNELAAAIDRLIPGPSIAPIHEAVRPGDVLHSQASIERAGERLGYAPKVDLEEGLRRTLAHYQALAEG